ncbi:MAG TPA: hypothetical protein VE135_01640 [Pyrinomonadaceae bacterium]|nr:hypothetical protein [Pyrinomonadaceae bacterium]
MIGEFEQWLKSREQLFKNSGAVLSFKRRDAPTAAAVATLESKSLVASITVWDTGACDVDTISYETGESVLAQHYDVRSFEELIPVLQEVVALFVRQ